MSKADIQGFSISDKCCAVIGCGGLGCNVLVHLVGSGIKKLVIYDFDIINESNLNRQFLYSNKDIGKKKVDIAKQSLESYNSNSEIITVHNKISNFNDLDLLKNVDIVILCVDNNEARKIVSDYCEKNNIALVNGGINGFYGNAYLFIPQKTPTLDEIGIISVHEQSKVYSVSMTAGVIGSLCASLAVKFLLGNNSQGGKLFIYDNFEIHSLEMMR